MNDGWSCFKIYGVLVNVFYCLLYVLGKDELLNMNDLVVVMLKLRVVEIDLKLELIGLGDIRIE